SVVDGIPVIYNRRGASRIVEVPSSQQPDKDSPSCFPASCRSRIDHSVSPVRVVCSGDWHDGRCGMAHAFRYGRCEHTEVGPDALYWLCTYVRILRAHARRCLSSCTTQRALCVRHHRPHFFSWFCILYDICSRTHYPPRSVGNRRKAVSSFSLRAPRSSRDFRAAAYYRRNEPLALRGSRYQRVDNGNGHGVLLCYAFVSPDLCPP